MTTRSLLLVTYHFPPSAACGGYRMVGFCARLPEHGWKTVVVAPPSLPWEPVDPAAPRPDPATTRVVETPYSLNPLGKPVRKFFPYAVWLPRALASAAREVKRNRPDAVLTSGPPHGIHWVGLALKKRFGLPWVADFRDPWFTDAPPGHGPLDRWTRAWAEHFLLARADQALINTEYGRASLERKYPALVGRLVTVPNGFDPERFPPYAPPPRRDSVRLTYTGELYNGRDPRPFLDAVKMVCGRRPAGRKPLEVSLVGRLNEGGAILAEEVKRRGLEGVVRAAGHVPYEESLARMRDADLLLILNAPGRPVGVHAKLYEYLGAGRPVLALAEADGDMAWVLRESGAPHRLAPPGDPAAIAEALEGLLDDLEAGPLPPAPAERLGAFTRASTGARLAAVLDRLTPRSDSLREEAMAGAGR
jgi:glycosyltransferase involved in cell wall biosynthesis